MNGVHPTDENHGLNGAERDIRRQHVQGFLRRS
jgi:hypothetical protein